MSNDDQYFTTLNEELGIFFTATVGFNVIAKIKQCFIFISV